MGWTKRQQEVIDARKQNILVSAAAGSGKTAVLIERILGLITDVEHPIDVDRLLVVTFTNAAAGEMKERLLTGLQEKYEELQKEKKGSFLETHIQKQMNYIHNANICTIDSFCSTVFRDNFDKIDVDPNITIADAAELKMVQADVLSELMNEKYASSDEQFMILADRYTGPKGNSEFTEMIGDLYEKSASFPDQKGWLLKCKEKNCFPDKNAVKVSELYKSVLENFHNDIRSVISANKEAIDILDNSEADNRKNEVNKFKGELEKQLSEFLMIEKYYNDKEYDTARAQMLGVKIGNRKKCSEKMCDSELKAVSLKNMVNDYFDVFKKKIYAVLNFEDLADDLVETGVIVSALIDFEIEFIERFNAKKRELGIMDFSDQEHFAHAILLRKDENGNFVPTEVAKEIAKQYEEIMIDEYQDSNRLQEDILTAISKGRGYNNVFMVGDVKQSIYRFRQAEPELFNEKFENYETRENAEFRKIILDKNFRSRKEVIDSVNYVFKYLMHKEFGGIEYDSDQMLEVGASYPDLPLGQDNTTELLLVEGNAEEEAEAIAEKIKELTQGGNFKICKKSGDEDIYETPEYRDIVILLRGVKVSADTYVKALENNGIPAYYESSAGFYAAKEVNTVIEFLKIIDNPYQDISLVTVLKSPMYSFTSTQLAKIRLCEKKSSYYEALITYCNSDEAEEIIKEKANSFINNLNRYRDIVSCTKVYEYICMILNDHKYDDYVLAMPGGSRRIKNLEILKEKAIAYDEGVYNGLFNFIRYIEKIKELNRDEGEALSVNENDNIVKIMTMHKSKGLQFPIVFVSGIQKKINFREDRISMHKELGIGIDNIDPGFRIKSKTLLRDRISAWNKREEIAEEVRLLYVAMTRAKEKMYITGAVKNAESVIESWHECAEETVENYTAWISGVKQYSDLLGPVVLRDKDVPIKLSLISSSDDDENEESDAKVNASCRKDRDYYDNLDTKTVYDEKVFNHLNRVFEWKYAHEGEYNYPAKMTVSEVKRRFADRYNEEEDGDNIYSPESGRKSETSIIPKFMQKEDRPLKGSSLGTAYHKIFELFDYTVKPDMDGIKAMIEKMLEDRMIDETIVKSIDMGQLFKFTRTGLYLRMKKAFKNGTLYRERAFLMGTDCDSLSSEELSASFKEKNKGEQVVDSDKTVLIQGIIDACFLEDGGYVIVDYKTDNVLNPNELADKYRVQLLCYAKAVNQITGVPVSELIIYSVKFGQEIKVDVL